MPKPTIDKAFVINEGLDEYLDGPVRPAALIEAAGLLDEAGVKGVSSLSTSDGADAILIAEAVNWGAKVIDPLLYGIKPRVIAAAAAMEGVTAGWGDDGCFYLCHQSVGTACFHDPFGELMGCLSPEQGSERWPWPWSRVFRQDHAFTLIANPKARQRMAQITMPGELGERARKALPVLAGPIGVLP